MTLIGIALSAWLLPAISRQWDDRQKAHELQASLVGDMASATAKALIAGQDALLVRQRPGEAGRPGEEQWAIKSFEIESELRTFFSPTVVQSWNRYRTLVSGALGASYHRYYLLELSTPSRPKSRRLYPSATFELNRLEGELGREHSRFQAFSTNSGAFEAWASLEQDLALLENQTATAVLAASPKGYSTTLGDFIHDLVPGAG